MALPFAAAAVVALATTACGGAPSGAPAAGIAPGAMAVPVEMVALQVQPVEQVGDFVGTIKSRRVD